MSESYLDWSLSVVRGLSQSSRQINETGNVVTPFYKRAGEK